MDITIENIILIGSLLLFLSVLAGRTSYKFGVPTLLLFLAIGMIAGSEGLGGIYFDNPKIAQFIGVVALNFILFSGGLDTHWPTVKPVVWQGVMLSTVGVLLTTVSLGVFVWYLTDFSIYEGLLLGAIVSSTDAAAVFSILRAKNLALKSNIRPTLELESGSNDPMAYVLTIAFLGLVINQNMAPADMILVFLKQMSIGLIAGFGFGVLSHLAMSRLQLGFEGLYPVLAIALMFMAFSVTDFAGGNGFLSVYICSVYLGNKTFNQKRLIFKIFDGLAWLMQILLFLTLGLLVFPSQIIPFLGLGLLIALFQIFIARPFSVFVSLAFFKMKVRRRLYISWVGLRGAVPIVFATYPLLAGIDKADMIFNLVYFISVTSVMIQGTTLSVVAKWLKVALPSEDKPLNPIDIFMSQTTKTAIMELEIGKNDVAVGKTIQDLQLPAATHIGAVRRDGTYFAPSDTTVFAFGDQLIVLADRDMDPDDIQILLRKIP
jgi:cell volume regulation protein A